MMKKIIALFGLVILFTIHLHAQCGSCNTTVSSNNSSNRSVGNNSRLCFTGGTYTGAVTSISATGTICVGANATFNPSSISNFNGTIVVYGTANLPEVTIANSATKVINYGTVRFNNNVNFNSNGTITNHQNATMTFTQSLNLHNSGTLTNSGLIQMNNDFATSSGTTVSNNGTLRVKNNVQFDNTFNNYGYLYVENVIQINGGNFRNYCRMFGKNGLTNSSNLTQNHGFIWIGAATVLLNNNFHQTSNGEVRGVNFTNSATVTGSGRYYFTGTTTNNNSNFGLGGGGINFFDTNVSGGGTKIFDNQNANPHSSVVRVAFTPSDTFGVSPSGCSSSYCSPITANAGANQSRCNGSNSFTMAANQPAGTTGIWRLVSGTATITNTTSQTTTVSVSAGNTAVLRWVLSNYCSVDSATVTITHSLPPTTANAGSNQTQCGNGSFTMAANNPSVGTGAWSVVSGTATIANAALRTTGVSGVPSGASATLRWTVSNPGCTSSTSDVTITNTAPPTAANAGTDQSRCGGGSTFTLAANNPSSGTGAWSVVSGTANIMNPAQHNSTVQVVSGKNAVLRWTISKPGCTSSTSDVQITNHYEAPKANAGSDQTKCSNTFNLNANSTRLVVVSNTTLASNGTSGGATVQAYGGKAPYTYQWSNGSSQQNQLNLPIGTYTVTVSDDEGSQVVREVKIVGVNNVVKKGSFLVNLGSATQTYANSMRPYGMVYDLVNNFNIPVYWVIKPNKAKDATDFTHNGVAYKGSAFVIPVEFRTHRVDSVISHWTSQGVVGATSVSDIELPIAQVITSFPTLIIDQANQSLVAPIFTNAGIPSSVYRVGLPSDLSSCDDLYALPHADPTWNNHNFLRTFCNNGGYIWSGCHAVSMFEGLFNPSNTSQRMNFLSTTGLQCYDGSKCGSLITQTHAKTPTSPFSYNSGASSHPIMQFMGDMTPATASGSEQWFIPQTTGAWRSGVVRAVTTANGSAGKEGVKLVFGHGFGDTTKGMIMYVGGHNITNTGSVAAMVAAQRSFLNFALLAGNKKKVEISHNISENYIAGSTNPVSVTPTGGTPPYTYNWSSTGEIFLSATNTSSINITVPEFATGTKCFLTCVVGDACGRKNFISVPINSINMPPDSADLTVTGRWRVVSGSGTISDTTKNNATATIPQGTTARLEWRIQSGVCGTTRDSITLVSSVLPTTANAGEDQERTNGSATFTLAANTPSVGIGEWTVVEGNAEVNNLASPTSTVTVNLGDTARLRWTIANGTCESTDEVVIKHFVKGCVAVNNGEWNDETTWSGNCNGDNGYPGITDTAVISGKTVTVSSVSAAKELWLSNAIGNGRVEIQNNAELTIAADVDMNASSQNTVAITLAAGSKLSLGGTVKRRAAPSNFGRITSHATSSIIFNGTQPQVIPTSNGRASDAIQYQNVVFNNSSGASPAFVAEGRVNVLNTITLLNGCIDMAGDTLMLLNNDDLSVTGGNDSSFVMGPFCRYIGQSGKTYRWSVGRKNQEGEYWFELKNNLLVGTSYVCVEFENVPEDSRDGVNYVAEDVAVSQLAAEGVWHVHPNAQPTLGGYDVNVSTKHFSGLIDDNFVLIKRPSNSSVLSWSNGGGVLPQRGNPLRRVEARMTALSALTSFSEFGIGGGGGSSLPVKLTTFEAKAIENQFIRLHWITETEIDNMGFEIHRSTDGLDFNNIGWVDGNGTTTETKVYNYDDKTIDPNIRYYYRLKQIDFDAKFEYSPIASAEVRNVGGIIDIGEFVPNPAHGTVAIKANVESNMDAEFVFFDMMGRVQKRGAVNMTKGSHLYYFDINEVAAGNYVVAIITPGTKVSKRLIVY